MPRVFGRGSRSQPAALVSERDDAALFPAIRILERYGSAKSGRARRVRMGREQEPGLASAYDNLRYDLTAPRTYPSAIPI